MIPDKEKLPSGVGDCVFPPVQMSDVDIIVILNLRIDIDAFRLIYAV
jgi:hypothetical protein